MKKRTSEAQRLIDELDAELAASAARAGRTLSWSASERQIIASGRPMRCGTVCLSTSRRNSRDTMT